jgi:large subunit ribosomal protein L17
MKRGTVRKFGREHGVRAALLKSLATALIEHGKITTTHARAKTTSQYVDKLITRAKKQDIASRRLLVVTFGPKAVKKLMDDIAPKYKDRNGGYTRVVRMERRMSDGSPMAILEFVH